MTEQPSQNCTSVWWWYISALFSTGNVDIVTKTREKKEDSKIIISVRSPMSIAPRQLAEKLSQRDGLYSFFSRSACALPALCNRMSYLSLNVIATFALCRLKGIHNSTLDSRQVK